MEIENLIDNYIDKKDWKVNANSEIFYHLQGLYKRITDEASEHYWLNKVFNSEERELHKNKDIHIHKCSSLSAYCVGWDLEDILLSGFTGVVGNVSSKPAKHFSAAQGQIVNFFYTLTNEAPDGACALSSFDTYLAPFIFYDKISRTEIRQSLQEFLFNMNVPTKAGGQVVFSNISLDLRIPIHLKDKPVIIGGKYMDRVYGDFQAEADMFNTILAELFVEGDGNGRAFSWPIPTYSIGKDFDWESPPIEAIGRMTAKYGVPYFANYVNSDMKPEDAVSMCCRLRLDKRELLKKGGGLFGANPLTGSIGYVSLNLPRIGIIAENNWNAYYKRLEYLIDVSHTVLQKRRIFIENLTEKGFYPYSKFYLRQVKERTGKFWSNHFNTIGIVGMHESLINMSSEGLDTEKGVELAKDIMNFINDKISKLQIESGILYNLEASPAEETVYSMALKDKELFGTKARYISDKNSDVFYTNSTALPVNAVGDLFEALDLQDELQSLYTGGTVFHIFLGEEIDSGMSAINLIRNITENYKMPYITITPTFSICPEHGYIKGQVERCHRCDSVTEIYSRVVGKIAPISRWNLGKRSEFKSRKLFSV